LARALAGGSGWALLLHDSRAGRLVNQWAPDHLHALAGARPILALDMYEHAYHLDFGADANGYIEAALGNLDWPRLERLYAAALLGQAPPTAPDQPPDDLLTAEALRASPSAFVLLDVRLPGDRAKALLGIVGARWCPPEALGEWATAQAPARPVAVYCVYGFQVSIDAAARLRRHGVKVHRLAGGLAAWRALGGELAEVAADVRVRTEVRPVE